MADQLRWDYLSCYGHPNLKTPNIDSLAEKGVIFNSAYVQATVCGPSRASYYTGRTVFSHGSTWNQVPLPIGELTIGDYLRKSGIRTGVVGKTHMRPDTEGMNRLGISKNTEIGLIVSEPETNDKNFELLEGLDLAEYFITSKAIKIKGKEELKIEVIKTKGTKCPRCWKILDSKCGRCEDMIREST